MRMVTIGGKTNGDLAPKKRRKLGRTGHQRRA